MPGAFSDAEAVCFTSPSAASATPPTATLSALSSLRLDASGHLTGLPAGTPNIFASLPGVARVLSVTATSTADGEAMA